MSFPVIVATHERSGTHLTIDLLRKNFQECRSWRLPGEYLEMSFVNIDRIGIDADWPNTLEATKKQLRRSSNPVIKTHKTPKFHGFGEKEQDFALELLSKAKVVYVIRHPLKVLSSYQLMVDRFPARSSEEIKVFLQKEMKGGEAPLARWKNHIKEWEAHDDILVIKYEDIIRKTANTLNVIGDYLGMTHLNKVNPLPKHIRTRWQRRYMRLFQINPESTAVLGRGKDEKQRPSDWSKLIDSELCNILEGEIGEVLHTYNYKL